MSSKLTVRGIVFSALFAALLVVFSSVTINLGFSLVPITLGNLAVMMAGAFLGAGYGFFSMLLIVVGVAAGLPLLHGTGGISILTGPTGGYVAMYPISALITGLLMSRIKGNGAVAFVQILVAVVIGGLVVYVGGVAWLKHYAHFTLEKALVSGFYPFWIGDALKAVLTSLIVLPIRRLYPASRLVGKGGSSVAILD
jgi:biotin transport system substrate-specific component